MENEIKKIKIKKITNDDIYNKKEELIQYLKNIIGNNVSCVNVFISTLRETDTCIKDYVDDFDELMNIDISKLPLDELKKFVNEFEIILISTLFNTINNKAKDRYIITNIDIALRNSDIKNCEDIYSKINKLKEILSDNNITALVETLEYTKTNIGKYAKDFKELCRLDISKISLNELNQFEEEIEQYYDDLEYQFLSGDCSLD